MPVRPTVSRLLPLVLAFSGCVSIRPFEEVRRSVPDEHYLRIGGQLVYVEREGSRGEPVILIHGFGASSYSWRKIQPGLARSFQTVALDLNGFGYTQRPQEPERYSRAGQEKLILDVMDELGIESAHFIGHSYGGALTFWIAAEHPERVRSMVLVDSAAPTYPEDRRSRAASWRSLNNLFLRTFALRPRLIRKALEGSVYDGSIVTPELVQEYGDRVRIEGIGDAYYGLTARRRGPAPPVVDLAKLDIPTLILWGVQDRLVRIEDGRAAAARMPRAEFVALDKTGHMPMEEKPEEVLRLIEGFLARQER